MKKTSKKASNITKDVNDVAWGASATGFNSITVEGLKAMDRSLSPAEAYQLSIDLKTAISARAKAARAKWRFFQRSTGQEIVKGELIDLMRQPAPGWTSYRFTHDIISNWHLAGEIAISVLEKGNALEANRTGIPRVAGIYPLSPFRLQIQEPVTANDPSQIKQWRYTWPNGIVTIYSPENLLFTANFNPLSHCRGMAPALAGINEISSQYQAIKYNAQFFKNNAMPNHIVVLPKGTSQQDKEAFKDQYVSMHSTYNGQAHQVFFVTGGEGLEIVPLENKVKDAQFLELMKLSSSKINKLYHIPPVIGGEWDMTKFDSVDIQREVFFEECLVPDMEMLSQFLQVQLVDRYFAVSDFERTATKPRFSKIAKQSFEQAMEVGESQIVCLLDPDTLPMASKLKQSRLTYAQALQDTFKITPQEAAVETGFEFPDNPANTIVWHQNTSTQFSLEQVVDPPQTDLDEATAVDPEITQEETEKAKDYKSFYRDFRKMCLDKVDEGRLFRLKEADDLVKESFGVSDSTLEASIRKDYGLLYQQFKNVKAPEERKQLVKSLLNSKTRAFFKELAKGSK